MNRGRERGREYARRWGIETQVRTGREDHV